MSSRYGGNSAGSGEPSSARYEPRYNLDSSRLNGSLSRNNFVSSSYHGSAAANYLSRPSYVNSRSHEESFGSNSIKSPQSGRYDKLNSYSETNSPRDYNPSGQSPRDYNHTSPPTSSTQRKYSFETLDHHYTPKGTRKYGHETNDQRKYDSRLESPGERQERGNRKYPNLPVPDQSRGREPTRESRNFINPSSWKIGSWTLSSPLNLRKFRTTSSDRTSTFDRNLRLQPGYRSLNERDKHVYSSSGKSNTENF